MNKVNFRFKNQWWDCSEVWWWGWFALYMAALR